MANYSRVQRGMVFWFNPDEVYGDSMEFEGFNNHKTYKSSVQHGKRPWLVVSNDDGNQSSYTCNVVPLTTEDKANIPVHIHFDYEGRRNTILCEQPRTIDKAALGSYLYTISDELMFKVEKAMAVQFGIRPVITYTDFTLDNVVDHLRNIVDHILQEKSKMIEQQVQSQQNRGGGVPMSKIEDAAIELGSVIENLVGVTPSVNPKTIVEEKPEQKEKPQILADTQPKTVTTGNSQIDKFNRRMEKSQQLQSGKKQQPQQPTPEKKSKRNSWTEESRKQYLQDCETMTPQELMKKYNFKSIQSVFQTKYACKNALGITD